MLQGRDSGEGEWEQSFGLVNITATLDYHAMRVLSWNIVSLPWAPSHSLTAALPLEQC